MCSSLSGGPGDLEQVESALVADAAPDAVGRLGHRVPMERQLVALFEKDVVRPATKPGDGLFRAKSSAQADITKHGAVFKDA